MADERRQHGPPAASSSVKFTTRLMRAGTSFMRREGTGGRTAIHMQREGTAGRAAAAVPPLTRLASSIESLAMRIRQAHPEIMPRKPWRVEHVGSTVNLKQSRAPFGLSKAQGRPRPGVKAPEGTLLSAADVRQEGTHLLAHADTWEARIVPLSSFKDLFADRLVGTYLSAEQLHDAWDTSGDDKISVAEFRLQVRALGFSTQQVTVYEIDELFRTLDANGSKFLLLREVQSAFKRMQVAIARYDARVASARDAAQQLRDAAAVHETAAKRTATLESQSHQLELRKTGFGRLSSLEQQLGKAMCQRNVKLSDVGHGGAFAWCSKLLFRQSVRALGLHEADADALDSLYGSLDEDGDNTLRLPELKRALARLQTAAAVAAADDADQVIVVAEVRAEALRAQEEAEKARERVRDLAEEAAAILAATRGDAPADAPPGDGELVEAGASSAAKCPGAIEIEDLFAAVAAGPRSIPRATPKATPRTTPRAVPRATPRATPRPAINGPKLKGTPRTPSAASPLQPPWKV